MKVLILTHGGRGDVQPFVALAGALDAAGHSTVLGIPAAFTGFAQAYGLRSFPLDDSGLWRYFDEPEAAAVLETGMKGPRQAVMIMGSIRRHRMLMVPVLRDMAAAAAGGADVVVHHPLIPGHHVAEMLGVPAVLVGLQPLWVPTGKFPNPLFNPLVRLPRLPGALNRATYHVSVHPIAGLVRGWRRHVLGLPPRRGQHNMLRQPDGSPTTVLHAFSQHLLPTPMDYPSSVHTTGAWHLPAPRNWAPPPALTQFLAGGEPPVFVGFSSMTGADPHRTAALVVEAVRRAGARAVLGAGEGGMRLDQHGKDVLLVEQVPFDWLFPRMAAIVHHGGAGTTAEAVASAHPQVICPFLLVADQLFWAQRMQALGVAAAPIPQPKLTVEGLAAAIRRAVTDHSMAQRAQQLAVRVRAEDGLTRAVRILESVVNPDVPAPWRPVDRAR